MKQKESSMIDFIRQFNDNEGCKNHLLNMRWPDGFKCPHCNYNKFYYHSTRNLYQCKSCKYQASITAGTIFHKTRIPLQKWFLMIYFLATSKSGISILSLQKRSGIKSYQTAWHMSHKIRSAMGQRDTKYILNGYIDVDEAYFGGKKNKGKQGRGSENKTCGLVALSMKEPGEYPQFVSINTIENASGKEIKKIVIDKISKDSRVRSDGWNGYKVVDKSFNSWDKIICKTNEDKVKTFKWINIIISNFKGIIRGVYHGVKSKHYQNYFNEFSYRFNRRQVFEELFNRLLYASVTSKVLTYSELVG